MRKRRLIVLLGLLLVAGACTPPATYRVVEGTMLGTTLRIVAQTPTDAADLYREAMRVDREAKASMSLFDERSLLNRLNRSETDSLDRHIAFNILLADSLSRLSGGAYDITIAPLTRAWGFAGREADRRPNVDSLLQFVGYEKVRIEGDRLVKSDPRVQLDLNSIAKGYTVDLLAEMLEEQGVENYLVDVGGEVRCRGVNRSGNAWRIGIETPFDGNMTNGEHIQQRIALGEGALATSGNYRRFYLDAEGRKVAHTIDPHTGYSTLSRLLSATVVAPSCAEADALCTMLMALGAERAVAFAEAHPALPVYLIFSSDTEQEYEEYYSEAMRERML
ncbi:MAG: FAD:protein FMN transferase [Alistipes sp.]|nr:FAD:protein FMN transferase [Alistipes sp.]